LTALGNTLATRDLDAAVRIAAFRAITFRGYSASADLVRHVSDDRNPIIRAAARQFLQELARRDVSCAVK
jgi:hypothetical protein